MYIVTAGIILALCSTLMGSLHSQRADQIVFGVDGEEIESPLALVKDAKFIEPLRNYRRKVMAWSLRVEARSDSKFPKVVLIIEKLADQLDYVLVDMPGQIEIFTSSTFGAIITEAFVSTFSTVIAYVVDTPQSSNPVTFMSNML